MFFYFIFYFSEKTSLDSSCESSAKTSLDISCESSAWQTIHMKCQDLFSLKKKKKKKKKKNLECRLLQILLGALRVKWHIVTVKGTEYT